MPRRQNVLVVPPRLRIPFAEFEFTFARSSGPGGQNVQKVNSKAILRWNVADSPSLPSDVRERFTARFGSRLTHEGHLLISSQRYRDQGRNVNDCLARLSAMLSSVAKPPVKRRPTRPTHASVERRITGKRRTSEKKRRRGGPSAEDE